MLDIRDIGAVPGTDVTAKIAEAFADSDRVRVPVGDWFASSIVLSAGKTLATDGFATVLHQVAGQPEGTRLVNVVGSDVVIEPLTIMGNIATDTGEQMHGIFVQGSAAISNVQIGAVRGKNIRGDVVYIGGLATASVKDVRVGEVTADNVLRNGVSVTGGERIRVEAVISLGQVGYAIFDVEPNGNSQVCDDIRIGYAKGRRCAISGGQTYPVGHVECGFLDLDEAFQANTTPPYASFDGLKYQAVGLHNFGTVKIGRLRANNHTYAAIRVITTTGDHVADKLQIDEIELSNCSLTDPSYSYYVIGSDPYLRRMEINGGRVTLHASGKRFVGGQAGVIVRNLWCNGSVTHECPGARLESVTVESTYDVYVCGGTVGTTPGATFIGSRVAFTGAGVGRISAHNRNAVIASDITANNFLFPSGCPDVTFIASTINGTFHLSG